MSITLDKQPLTLTVADVEGGDTIVFEDSPDRVFLVTTTMLDEDPPVAGFTLLQIWRSEDGPDNWRLLVDLDSGRPRPAHLTEPCIKVNVASAIV